MTLAAAASLVPGVWLARVRVALELRRIFAELAAAPDPSARVLLDQIATLRTTEVLGEALIGVAVVLLVLVGARAVRAPRGVTILALMLALASPIANVLRPTTTVPEMLTIAPPSSEWPLGAVLADRSHWNAYQVITKNQEWAVLFEGSELGPLGLSLALGRRFEKPNGKRPVTLYLDPRCAQDAQVEFERAATAAVTSAGVPLAVEKLPARDDFYVARKRNREKQLEPYRETILVTTAARFAAAVALALVTWWADRNARARGATAVAGAHLLLALGFAFSVPVTLYAAMLPDTSGGRSAFDMVAQNVLPHVGMLLVSALGLTVGALVAAVGHVVLDESAIGPVEEDAAAVRRRAYRARAAARAGEASPAPPAEAPPAEAPPAQAPPAQAPPADAPPQAPS